MHNRLTILIVLMSLGFFAHQAATAESEENKDSQKAAAEQKKTKHDGAAQREAAEVKATKNVESLLSRLDLSSSQRAKIKALLSKQQWKAAVSAFTTSRESDIHNEAHKIVRSTVPRMMQSFMPGYMRDKISAQRRNQKRRGPPSASEIAEIRKQAKAKMQPAMRKTVMPALDTLTKQRLAEMLRDEKTMTRIMADRILAAKLLSDSQAKEFQAQLEEAEYPAQLTSGADAVLNDRTKKMLQGIDLKAVAKSAGL